MNDLIPGVTITGSVVYKGNDIYSPKTDIVGLRKKEIGMVFQQPNPFPFSIYENVIYGLKIKGEKTKSVRPSSRRELESKDLFGKMSKINCIKVRCLYQVDNNKGCVLPVC